MLLLPVLWIGGTVLVLGGGAFALHAFHIW